MRNIYMIQLCVLSDLMTSIKIFSDSEMNNSPDTFSAFPYGGDVTTPRNYIFLGEII